jgi:hypothetical protein
MVTIPYNIYTIIYYNSLTIVRGIFLKFFKKFRPVQKKMLEKARRNFELKI